MPKGLSKTLRGPQKLSEAFRCCQRLSDALRGSQKLSEALRCSQRLSEALRGSQKLSEALRGSQRLPEAPSGGVFPSGGLYRDFYEGRDSYSDSYLNRVRPVTLGILGA